VTQYAINFFTPTPSSAVAAAFGLSIPP
jgi:hypothetical protein